MNTAKIKLINALKEEQEAKAKETLINGFIDLTRVDSIGSSKFEAYH